MKFSEVVGQTIAWLQREGRVSYRALKREFDLDDEYIEDLKVELIETKELAVDKEGKMLVWTGASPVSSSKFQVSSPQSLTSNPQPPVSYTPRIWPSVFSPSRRRWQRGASPTVNARPSPPCLQTSKARRP
jgi:hypothetical protein